MACFAELPFDGLVAVDVRVYLPDRRDRDLDNLWKVIMDSLTHAKILKDDSWKYVVKESIEAVGEVRINDKGEPEFIPEIVKDGRVVVKIKELK
ncbi:RusA family crossover junction endodeoxyribonuclease [Glaesserella parasuis]|nr:RusA family crossover junction endodeoxyribonuclease [Glaesserella parasuis]